MKNDWWNLLIQFAIFCFVVGTIITFCSIKLFEFINDNKGIESSKPIIPIKKLVINNNKVDTIYVYRKP